MVVEADERPPLPLGNQTSARAARLVGFAPALAFLVTFGFFFVDKNREARTVLRSGRGLLAVAAVVLGYVAIGIVLRRFVRWAWVPPVVLTAVVLGLAAWIVRPYYVDETANRTLVSGPVRDQSADTGPSPTGAALGEDPPGEAVALRTGAGPLRGIDHDATGTASLVRAPDGAHVVRLEDFDIEGVPDPQVYLVRGEDVRDPGGTHLGRLPGNQGEVLDIAVPDGTGAGAGWTLLVWCRSFSVPVANATLASN
jgi:Electron transfer DM13